MLSYFEKRINPFPKGSPTQPPNTLLAFCRFYSRGSGPSLFIMGTFSAVVAAIEILIFKFLGELVDLMNNTGPETFLADSSHYLYWMGFVVLIGLPVATLFHSTSLFQSILPNFPMMIRWQAHRYLLDQSLSFFQDEFAGRISTKLMQTALSVREAVVKILDVFLYCLVFFVGAIAMAASMNALMAIPFIIWAILYGFTIWYFIPKLRDISTKQSNARSEMTGRIVDSYSNISTVKLFSHTQREAQYAKESMSNFLNTTYPQMRLVTLYNISVIALNALLIFSIVALSIYLWINQGISAGLIAASTAVVMRLYGLSQWLMWEMSGLFEHIGTVIDGMNTLSRPQAIKDKDNAKDLEVTRGEVQFKNVDFGYGKDNKIIQGLNLTIKPGEKVGLVGRSGAGKSTLVNLLLRFYDTEAGVLYIDGQGLSDVKQNSIRQNIGMVTQDTSLLHRSIQDNIAYGKPHSTREEVEQAALRAKAHDFILDLADAKGRKGYDAHVGERGVMLSGGQRQRVAIARVLLKNAPILILDEATSALDSEVESVIQENLNELMENKTVIAIAHRLSTIAAMDRLIVMDEGKIVEEGSHSELLALGGIYAQLWAKQSGGFVAP